MIMNVEERIIDLLNDEFRDDSQREFKILSEYKFNGKTVPRVTAILSEMQSDQGLLNYSNYLGFNHINYRQMLDNASSIGKETHSFIENYIQEKEYKTPEREEVINCTNAFIKWWNMINSSCKVEVLAEEQSVTCPWFGGTFDLLLKVNDKITLIDFKTSNHISFRYFMQLAAYKYLINYKFNIPIDTMIILRMDKKTSDYEMVSVDLSNPDDSKFIDYCTYSFFSQVNNYYALSRVKYIYNKLMKENNSITS